MTEETMAFGWMGLRLTGSLHSPDAIAPHPVVVMLQGSGPSDRWADGYFSPIREAFLARGIGTFAFDKPGCGESSGDWRNHGLYDRADQVIAALAHLRQHPKVKANNVGLWGHSQGGWVVQMLAARLQGLPFAIANSGPSIALPAQDLYGCEHSMRADGRPEADIDLALGFLAEVHEAARQGLSFETVRTRLLEPAKAQPWYGYLTFDEEADWKLVSRFVTERYEPLEALQQIRCPYLAVYGGRDVLLPAWRSAEETGVALQQAGNQDSAVVVFPEGNHRIQQNGGGFVTGYLDLLADWAVRHAT
jgi:pimeloyl-ACP methyl ester carboxylesterase